MWYMMWGGCLCRWCFQEKREGVSGIILNKEIKGRESADLKKKREREMRKEIRLGFGRERD